MSNDTTVVQPLSDIQDVEPYSEKDEALFAEFKAVLERHGC